MAKERDGAVKNANPSAVDNRVEAQWQRTLWATVGIRFVITGVSVLSPAPVRTRLAPGWQWDSDIPAWACRHAAMRGLTSSHISRIAVSTFW